KSKTQQDFARMRRRWMDVPIRRDSVMAGCAHPGRHSVDTKPDSPPRSSMDSRAARVAASRFVVRFALLSFLAALSAGTVRLHAQSAKSWYKQGQQAEAREDYDRAFNDYQKAYSMTPKELTY